MNEIIENNKLIANFMGFTYSYNCSLSRGGGVMKNVDLLSKIKFMTLPELLASNINNEAAPCYNNTGICIGKYVTDFYDNVIFFSTDNDKVPSTIQYNERFQSYHSSWNWLMPVLIKIEHDFTDFEVIIYSTSCVIHKVNHSVRFHEVGPKIESVYRVIIEFINWYNGNKGTN